MLLELPELVRKDEWCEFTVAERRAYDDAVRSGNFSAMRRASFSSTDPVACSKINRLLNLVSTALANGRRVVVFSYFLSTLATVTAALRESGGSPEVLGPLTGTTHAAERQAMGDALSAVASTHLDGYNRQVVFSFCVVAYNAIQVTARQAW